ncbi:MAG: hypothetical protein GYA45_11815 [Pelolinea sp.]|nr:hypothetical protein [Pelolinea sp.]
MKTRKLMSEYWNLYRGRPAAVLGGGPSLPEDMKKLPKNCVLIAVNYHALELCKADFMVFNDEPDNDLMMVKAVEKHEQILVSPGPLSDIKFDEPVWVGFYSSNTATWFALWMGCDPVILCGMDCYQGDKAYFHEYEDKPHFHYPLEHHITPWVEEAKNMLPNWQRVKVMSGPLERVFGKYQVTE